MKNMVYQKYRNPLGVVYEIVEYKGKTTTKVTVPEIMKARSPLIMAELESINDLEGDEIKEFIQEGLFMLEEKREQLI